MWMKPLALRSFWQPRWILEAKVFTDEIKGREGGRGEIGNEKVRESNNKNQQSTQPPYLKRCLDNEICKINDQSAWHGDFARRLWIGGDWGQIEDLVHQVFEIESGEG